VEYPEAAAVGCDGEVVAVNDDVAHGGDGHVELERLPVVAVVEGDVDAELCGGVEEASLLRVFFDGVDEGAFGNAVRDSSPGLASVVRAVDIGALVGEAMAVDGDVGSLLVK